MGKQKQKPEGREDETRWPQRRRRKRRRQSSRGSGSCMTTAPSPRKRPPKCTKLRRSKHLRPFLQVRSVASSRERKKKERERQRELFGNVLSTLFLFPFSSPSFLVFFPPPPPSSSSSSSSFMKKAKLTFSCSLFFLFFFFLVSFFLIFCSSLLFSSNCFCPGIENLEKTIVSYSAPIVGKVTDIAPKVISEADKRVDTVVSTVDKYVSKDNIEAFKKTRQESLKQIEEILSKLSVGSVMY